MVGACIGMRFICKILLPKHGRSSVLHQIVTDNEKGFIFSILNGKSHGLIQLNYYFDSKVRLIGQEDIAVCPVETERFGVPRDLVKPLI